MAESGLRSHIYLTGRAVVEFATRQRRADRPLDRNVGPKPVIDPTCIAPLSGSCS